MVGSELAAVRTVDGNGRALFGLLESLKAQGKATDARWVEPAFQRAWSRADTPLRIEDL